MWAPSTTEATDRESRWGLTALQGWPTRRSASATLRPPSVASGSPALGTPDFRALRNGAGTLMLKGAWIVGRPTRRLATRMSSPRRGLTLGFESSPRGRKRARAGAIVTWRPKRPNPARRSPGEPGEASRCDARVPCRAAERTHRALFPRPLEGAGPFGISRDSREIDPGVILCRAGAFRRRGRDE